MSVAFWSAEIKSGGNVSVQPPEGYVLNLQQAALQSSDKGAALVKAATTSIEGDDINALLCTLRGERTEQCQMSMVFGYDVAVVFSVSGDTKGTVHLSGYYQPGPEDEDEGDDFDEEDEEDDDEEIDADTYRKLLASTKAITGDDDEDDEDEDDEDEDDEEDDTEDEAANEALIAKMIKKNALTGKDFGAASSKFPTSNKVKVLPEVNQEDDSEDEDEDSDEDSDEEDEEPAMKKPAVSAQKKPLQQQQQHEKPKQQNQQQKGGNNNNNKPPLPKQAFQQGKGGQQGKQGGFKPNNGGGGGGGWNNKPGDKRKR